MKKGFTLVELLIALALLLMAVTGINLVYSNASQIWKLGGYKATTGAFNQEVAQRLRAEGKKNILKIAKYIDNPSDSTNALTPYGYFYLYFNSADAITTAGVSNYDGINDAIDAAIDGNNTHHNFITLKHTLGSFNDCVNPSLDPLQKGRGFKYGAMVGISNYTDTSLTTLSTNTLTRCDITVWNLKQTDLSKAESIFYIGR